MCLATRGSATAEAAVLISDKTVLGLIRRTREMSRMPEAFIIIGKTN
ncbi:MAG: hypothetical protein V7641_3569 [Blastocatellia bacterium]